MDSKEIIGNAMEEVLDDEFDKYINDLPLYADHKFSDRHNRKMRKLIKRQRKPYFKLISTVGRRAACIVTAVLIFSASALSVEAVRKEVFDLIINKFTDRSGVVTVESSTDEDYPDTIEEEYYISALPDGFEETSNSRSETNNYMVYSKEEDYIIFSQFTKSEFKLYFDDEYPEYSIDPEGEKYFIIKTDYDKIYIWNNERYAFYVQSNLDKDTILNLCNSIKVKE